MLSFLTPRSPNHKQSQQYKWDTQQLAHIEQNGVFKSYLHLLKKFNKKAETKYTD